MALPLPEKFDENEWFIIATLISGVLLYIFLPKRFPGSMALLIMLFSSFYARTVDHILAAPFFDFYDVMDAPEYELFGVFTYFMYAPFAYLFIFLFDKLSIQGMYIALYIVICSLFALFFEWISTTLHIFTFNQWKPGYSLTVYLFVQFCTILFYLYLKRIYRLTEQ